MARLGRAFTGFIWTRGPIVLGQSWTTFQGAAALSVTASLSATGVDVQPASAVTLAPVVTMTLGAPIGIPQGAAGMTVTASLAADSTVIKPSAVAMSATVSMTTAAVAVRPAAVDMSVAASMTTKATEAQFAVVAMTPTFTMVVSQATALQGAASLAVTGSMSIAATQNFAVAALLTPSGNMTVAAIRAPQAAVDMVVVGSVLAGASGITLAVVSMSSEFSLTPAAGGTFPAGIHLAMAFTVSSQSKQTQFAAVTMQPNVTVIITGFFNPTTSVHMIVSSSVIASGVIGLTVTTGQPYYLRQSQNWAIQQEQQRHAQALYMVGEMACIILMWHEIDFQRGLVSRCATCYNTPDLITNRITQVYNQPTRNLCPDCFGTTFEGGFRARIVRPTIMTDVDESEKIDRHGAMHPSSMNMETTWDFRSRSGDYLLRADGSRWRLSEPQRTTLRTGFQHPAQATTSISYGNIRAQYEEETTVVYLIPPTDTLELNTLLTAQAFFPPDFSAFEIIRAPLIPESIQD